MRYANTNEDNCSNNLGKGARERVQSNIYHLPFPLVTDMAWDRGKSTKMRGKNKISKYREKN